MTVNRMSPSSATGANLLTLPRDIQVLIVDHLRPPDGPLFIPSVIKDSRDPEEVMHIDLSQKMSELYGQATDDQIMSSEGLLSWSTTCWYFRKLIAPVLFHTIILRPRQKSLRSIKTLSQTNSWSQVRHLVFAGIDLPGSGNSTQQDKGSNSTPSDEAEAQSGQPSEAEQCDVMLELSSILASLPPHLTSLTLDFVSTWPGMWAFENFSFDGHNYFDDDEGLTEAEQMDAYRLLMYTVLDAVLQNDISKKSKFEVQLYNIPPVRCSIFERPRFHQWLSAITSFNISFCEWGPGGLSQMNVMPAADKFAQKLDEWFFSHLANVQSLELHADATWPLGMAPGHCLLPLPLPATLQHLSQLTHVSFKEIFICPGLIQFLVIRAKQLVSIQLINCHAAGPYVDSEMPDVPTWADLFNALADARPNNLTHFSVPMVSIEVRSLYGSEDQEYATTEDVALVDDIVRKQREEEAEAYHSGATKADVWRRRRWVFRYSDIDDKWGATYPEDNVNVAHFLAGKDYEAYTRIIEIVEANMILENKSFFSTSGTIMPHGDRGNQLLDEIMNG